jgi:hypothetical protein
LELVVDVLDADFLESDFFASDGELVDEPDDDSDFDPAESDFGALSDELLESLDEGDEAEQPVVDEPVEQRVGQGQNGEQRRGSDEHLGEREEHGGQPTSRPFGWMKA